MHFNFQLVIGYCFQLQKQIPEHMALLLIIIYLLFFIIYELFIYSCLFILLYLSPPPWQSNLMDSRCFFCSYRHSFFIAWWRKSFLCCSLFIFVLLKPSLLLQFLFWYNSQSKFLEKQWRIMREGQGAEIEDLCEVLDLRRTTYFFVLSWSNIILL